MSILKTNKKAAAGIGIAAAAVAAIALGTGTYAAFHDAETGPSGTLAAGTLDLTIGATPASALNFTATNIRPGYTSGAPYTVTFHNAGTIPGNLSLAFASTQTEDGCTEPEKTDGDTTCDAGNAGELGAVLNVTIASGSQTLYSGPVGNIPNSSFPVGPLAANGDATYSVSYSLPQGVDNKVQGDGIAITTTADLVQQ